jgi:hypothetical protein
MKSCNYRSSAVKPDDNNDNKYCFTHSLDLSAITFVISMTGLEEHVYVYGTGTVLQTTDDGIWK